MLKKRSPNVTSKCCRLGMVPVVQNSSKDVSFLIDDSGHSLPECERQRLKWSRLSAGLSANPRGSKENYQASKPVQNSSKGKHEKRPLASRSNGVQNPNTVLPKHKSQVGGSKEKVATVSNLEKVSVYKDEPETSTTITSVKGRRTIGRKRQKEECIKRKAEERNKREEESKKWEEEPLGRLCEIKEEQDTEIEHNEPDTEVWTTLIQNNAEIIRVESGKEVGADLEEEEYVIPSDVSIIDNKLVKSEYFLGVYAQDIFRFLKDLEKTQAITENYITSAHYMTERARTILVDWIFEVQVSLRLLNDTIQLSIGIFDQFMQDHPRVIKEELQLVGIACIFLASKHEEIFPPDLESLVDICADTYTKFEILSMERVIISALDFRMLRALPTHFLRRYRMAGKVDNITYAFSKYFVDLGLLNYALCHVRPSLLAAASLYLSILITSDSDTDSDTELWTPTLRYYSQFSVEDLQSVVRKLASVVLKAQDSSYKAVPMKYLDVKMLYSVSTRPELRSMKLYNLAFDNDTSF